MFNPRSRNSETKNLKNHLNKLSKLIDSNRLVDFNTSTHKSTNPGNTFAFTKQPKTSTAFQRPNRSRLKRPTSSQNSRRTLTHNSTLSRPSTGKPFLSRPSTANNNNCNNFNKQSRASSVASMRRNKLTKSKSTIAKHRGTNSARPGTERSQHSGTFAVLKGRPQNLIHYPFLIGAQDSMLAISKLVNAKSHSSPNNGTTADLMQLRTVVERSKQVLLDRIDALLYNAGTSNNNINNNNRGSHF